MTDSTLAALCRLYGIETSWTDIWGRTHHVSPATQRALLRAMHVAGDDEAAWRDAIREREEREWRRPLPPVLVLREGDPIDLELRVPRETLGERVEYVFNAEGGASEHGAAESRATGHEHFGIHAFHIRVPITPSPGYHQLAFTGPGAECTLIVAPQTCYWPKALDASTRVWGPSVQLYAVRSRSNWGIGDFSDLRRITETFAELGAGIVGVSPLHALFPHNPEHASPYSPSSRRFLNVLFIDVEAVPDFPQCALAQQMVYEREYQKRLTNLRRADAVSYHAVMDAKLPVLELLHAHFREHQLMRGTDRGRAFTAFVADGGEQLRRHALYEALQEHFHRSDPSVGGWMQWPDEYRDPRSSAVASFAEQHAERIEFFTYLQWLADQQLGAVGDAAFQRHLAIGLYQDLSLSVDRAGAEAWANQDLYAAGASAGAPPDDFNLNGQNWGLPPLIPERLREARYAPFIDVLRANMRHAGALRIDHVMGLMRLFWIPDGAPGSAGTYVRYPFDDLLGIVALESQRLQCAVVGEDLGTVPDVVRSAMKERGILAYRVFYFERDTQGDFRPPSTYEESALVTVSTHDLPTLRGYWKGADLRERSELGLFPSDEHRAQQTLERSQDRARMLNALEREGLLPDGVTTDPASCPDMTPELARAIHEFASRAPSRVMMVQLEDIAGQDVQVNLPGTSIERPNWRFRLPVDIEDLFDDPRTEALAETLVAERGRGTLEDAELSHVQRMPATIPRATYRLQFNRDFTFAHAEGLVPYLARLGVSHVYASPWLKARPGSSHGYDIVDHNALNPEIGTREELDRLCETLSRHGMGQILDIVPNHMGVGSDNGWWMDVLENGPASAHADFFDIDWRPLKEGLRGKVLLPVLGDHYGRVLAAGELELQFDDASGDLTVHYHEHRFPIDPATYPDVLGHDLATLEKTLGVDDPRYLAWRSLLTAFVKLPPRSATDADLVIERNRDKEIHKHNLASQCAETPALRAHVDAAVAYFNEGVSAGGASALHALLERQAWRLAYWRTAAHEINYRRFFDINDLAGLRTHLPQVFFATHRLIADLVAQGKLQGLRVDHPDGLFDPAKYYADLQSHVAGSLSGSGSGDARGAIYVVAEKILTGSERLPSDWPIHGTSGYDFLNLVNGVLVRPDGERALDRIYHWFVGSSVDFDEELYQRKRLIMDGSLSSELHTLANQLNQISEADPTTRDYTLAALLDALTEVTACFPVYRTYITGHRVTDDDRRYIREAVDAARLRSRAADVSVFDFVEQMLLLDRLDERPADLRRAIVTFAMRFQQYTAPVHAKGLEDSTFYAYHRLLSLNEVGGDPRRCGVSLAQFHEANATRARDWPHAMLATSTHDTKRSEDVRARLDVLSELTQEWLDRVRYWSRLHRRRKRRVGATPAPDRDDEYLIYQTIVGAWPLEPMDEPALATFCERIEAYVIKAVREARTHTSWINRNEPYEEAVVRFVRLLLGAPDTAFISDLAPFAHRIASFGLYNSLTQTLLKLTAPGVPDCYQGCELWDFSLVDPDNRRPVDYARRATLLDQVSSQLADDAPNLPSCARSLLASMHDGRAKLFTTWRLLSVRAARPALFQDGSYTPLIASGAAADHVVAFARQHAHDTIIAVAPRWYAGLPFAGVEPPLGVKVWGDAAIRAPESFPVAYRNAFTGEAVRGREASDGVVVDVADVFANFPLALLVASEPPR